MKLTRFKRLIELHGTDFSHWGESDYKSALHLMKHSTDAQKVYNETKIAEAISKENLAKQAAEPPQEAISLKKPSISSIMEVCLISLFLIILCTAWFYDESKSAEPLQFNSNNQNLDVLINKAVEDAILEEELLHLL